MTLKLNGSSSGSVSIDAPASTTGGADVTLTLPVNDGDAGQVLKTDGSGNLSWTTPSPVLEEWFGICDGTTITLQDGDHTLDNPSDATAITTSFVKIDGSTLSYTPPRLSLLHI